MMAGMYGATNRRLVDKSGIVSWSRCWGLYDKRTTDGSQVLTRWVGLLSFQYSAGSLHWKFEDESMGPREYDCPLRLFNAANQFAPENDNAKEWRAEAFADRDRNRAFGALIRDIEDDYPHGDLRIVVDGRPATYLRGRYRGRSRRAYWNENDEAYALHMSVVDVPATRLLRALP